MFKLQMRTMDLFLLLGLILTGAPRAADGQESVTVKVAQGQDVILPCSVSTKEPDYFEWKKEEKDEVFFYQRGEPFGNDHAGQHKDFKGRVFHFKEELKDGNISIRITNTKKKDSGAYSCYSPQQVQRCHVQLEVGVCPKPHFTEISQALLLCEVSGVSPDLQLEIKDSSGTVLHAKRTQSPSDEGTIDIVLQMNVTKSGVYTCVATQEDICHQIFSKAYVGPLDSTLTYVLIGVICLLVLLVAILLWLYYQRGPSKDSSDHAADESAPMSP